MKKEKHIILGVHITNRLKEAVDVQRQLTAYGKNIKTRLGLHETKGEATELNGLLLLEMIGHDKDSQELQDKLNAIEGVEVQRMEFEHTVG